MRKRYILAFLLQISIYLVWAQSNVMICVSPTAHAYHSGYCKGLNACTHKVEIITLKEAKSIGKDPCGFCYGKTTRKLPVKESTSGQCKAVTKKGARCSRASRSDGYCWQHGG